MVCHLSEAWHLVPKGAAMLTGMGDLQCLTLAAMPGPHDAGMCSIHFNGVFLIFVI